MKKIAIALFVLAAATTTHAQNDVVVDPNAAIRTVNASFSAIRVSNAIDIYLSQSDNEAVAVSASEEKFREGIKTVVENGTLRIYYDGDKSLFKISKNRKLKVYVSFKNLEKIEASGACDVWVVGAITVPSLNLVMSGASGFKGKVSLGSLNMNLSGASDARIDGTSTTVNIESSGASDVKAYDLITEICTAKASGASDISITVNKELNAHASGASDIYFKGSGLIKDMHASGSSNISRKS